MTDLPRPDVSVTTGDLGNGHFGVNITISRDGQVRGYSGTASSHHGAVKEVVEKNA
jgi:hypothetical protein